MSKTAVFTPTDHVFESGNEISACFLYSNIQEQKFYKIIVMLSGGQQAILAPQSRAVAFIDELYEKGYYSEQEYKEIGQWLDIFWKDKVDRPERMPVSTPGRIHIPPTN